MLKAITNALSAIDTPGTFAVRQYLSPDELSLEVKGVGRVRLPVSKATARKLCKVGRKAPFGLRDKTLIDARIRDTWQIAKSRVKLDRRAFKSMMAPALTAIQTELGLAHGGTLSAELYKMLVYEPGQFFVPHQDSEKTDDMVGTLLLELPSDYSGGTVSVELRDQKKTFRRTKRSGQDVTLLAFYADCHHEVKPIKQGYRVVLSFNLRFRGKGSPVAPSAATLDQLVKRVSRYFSTERPATPYHNEPPGRPQRLVYLLDHEYTQKSLSWLQLKNGDRARAGALRAIAHELDCAAFLTLADIHEHWACQEEYGGGYGRYGQGYDRDGRDDENNDGNIGDDSGLILTELLDGDIELCHWIDEHGHLAAELGSSHVGDEVCFTTPSEDMEPFKSHHEGWMGNWGNTVERWYHRAALVMWPRAHDFIVRAEIGPAWGQEQLLKQLKRGDHDQAKERAEKVLAFWPSSMRGKQKPQVFNQALQVALLLDDAEMAAAWLQPFRLAQLSPARLPQLRRLITHYGLAWTQARITQWGSGSYGHDGALGAALVKLCDKLMAAGSAHDQSLAKWLVEREADLLVEHCNQVLSNVDYIDLRYRHRRIEKLMVELSYFLEAAAIGQATAHKDRILLALMDADKPPPPQLFGKLLQSLRDRHKPKSLRALGIDALYLQVTLSVERLVSRPARAQNDWSITPPDACDCSDCGELAAFLRAADKQALDWPMAKPRRRHMHEVIERDNLPVSHKTRRRGSPHVLMLRKLPALFEQDAKQRAHHRQLLTWLNKHRRAFLNER